MGGVVACTVKMGDSDEPLLLLWNCKDETLRCTSTHLRGDTSQFGLSLSDPVTDAVEEEKKKLKSFPASASPPLPFAPTPPAKQPFQATCNIIATDSHRPSTPTRGINRGDCNE